MKITIANKHCIPTNAITGRSAAELILELSATTERIFVVSVNSEYKGGVSGLQYPIELKHKLCDKKISAGSASNRKLDRLFYSLIENLKIARLVASETEGVIISMTDPPMLPYLMQAVARWRRRKWIYWSMDLYPQAFFAYFGWQQFGVIFKWVERFLFRLKPDAIIALGPKQASYLKETYRLNCPIFIIPCGIINNYSFDKNFYSIPDWRKDARDEVFGYIGNLGEGHDHLMVLKIIRALNREKKNVLLSVYGSKAKQLLDLVKNLSYVKCVDRVLENELQYIDVHIVTLRKMWTHICLPSKAISAVCSGSACIIAASKDGDLYFLLNEAAWWVDPDCSTDSDIDEMVNRISTEKILEKKRNSKIIRDRLVAIKNDGYSKLEQYLQSDSVC